MTKISQDRRTRIPVNPITPTPLVSDSCRLYIYTEAETGELIDG
jgi:hypothetical protein